MSFSDAPVLMPTTLSRFGGELMTANRSMALYTGMLAAFAFAYRPGGGGGAAMRAWFDRMPEIRAATTGAVSPRARTR